MRVLLKDGSGTRCAPFPNHFEINTLHTTICSVLKRSQSSCMVPRCVAARGASPSVPGDNDYPRSNSSLDWAHVVYMWWSIWYMSCRVNLLHEAYIQKGIPLCTSRCMGTMSQMAHTDAR